MSMERQGFGPPRWVDAFGAINFANFFGDPMQIEIRLKKLLADYGLDRHGITQRIADEINLHRHTVRRLYNNRHRNPSLKVLGRLCEWLQEHKVPAKILPGALFGACAGGLWQAAGAAGIVTIYLGEYQQTHAQAYIPWISRRDASVETEIVRRLSMPGVCGDVQPVLETQYLPFRVDVSSERIRRKELEEDHAAAVRMYKRMRSELNHSSAILVGSQRINWLVETLVADLFGCPPFVPESKEVRVPFYLAYQSRLRPVESCFGGLTIPPGAKGKFVKGTHYLNSDGQWTCCPWIDGKQDSGIVITAYEPGTKGMLLAVFGLSGRASEALGRYLTQNVTPFWPPYAEKHGRKIGVYVCKIIYPPKSSTEPGEPGIAKDVEVVPIDAAILTKYLKAR
jgi:transcriptional regulator with XRE-family HTH domain